MTRLNIFIALNILSMLNAQQPSPWYPMYTNETLIPIDCKSFKKRNKSGSIGRAK